MPRKTLAATALGAFAAAAAVAPGVAAADPIPLPVRPCVDRPCYVERPVFKLPPDCIQCGSLVFDRRDLVVQPVLEAGDLVALNPQPLPPGPPELAGAEGLAGVGG